MKISVSIIYDLCVSIGLEGTALATVRVLKMLLSDAQLILETEMKTL